MPGYGGVRVLPADIRQGFALASAGGLQGDDRPCAFQRKGLGDKVVLPTNAADHFVVRQTIGHHRAAQGDHDRAIDETSPAARLAFLRFVTV